MIVGNKNFHLGFVLGGNRLHHLRPKEPHFFWFRLFGYGLHIRFLTDHRYKGLSGKQYKLGRLWIRVLTKIGD